MQIKLRRRREAVLLVLISLGALVFLRSKVESPLWLWGEVGLVCLCLIGVAIPRRFRKAKFDREKNTRSTIGGAEPFASNPGTYASTHESETSHLKASHLKASQLKASQLKASHVKRPAGAWLGQLLLVLSCVTPVLVALIGRAVGYSIAYEITTLATLCATCLATACFAKSTRQMSLAIVASGFLVLFVSAISDHSYASGWAIGWLAVCMWHMVAKRWDAIQVCMPVNVKTSKSVRIWAVVAATLIVSICIGAFRSQFSEVFGASVAFSPFSGGSDWSDDGARGGLGTGDSAVAAKEHADSFGPVDSDLMLESKESSLFDMFNEILGDPQYRQAQKDRQQAIDGTPVQISHEEASQSETQGGSFAVKRTKTKDHQHLKDVKSGAILHWTGRAGTRLAMHRYDHFDGWTWTKKARLSQEQLQQIKAGHQFWSFERLNRAWEKFPTGELEFQGLRVIKLATTRVPTPGTGVGFHIKDIERPDFFAVANDQSIYMPGRRNVPSLIVIDMAMLPIMEDELVQLKMTRNNSQVFTDLQDCFDSDGGEWLTSEVKRVTEGIDSPYEKVRSIVRFLRTEFVFDRDASTTMQPSKSESSPSQDSADLDDARTRSIGFANESNDEETDELPPVEQFFRNRRGGDHLFATAAVLMARAVGLEARLVTGFYVPPNQIGSALGYHSIRPTDAHVWAEVKLDRTRWFEIEPTPTFAEPDYRPSLWLQSKRLMARYWPVLLAVSTGSGLAFRFRRWLLLFGLTAAWSARFALPIRRRIWLAFEILETRGQLAGASRQRGEPQRRWLEQWNRVEIPFYENIEPFCNLADDVVFGCKNVWDDQIAHAMVRKFRIPRASSDPFVPKKPSIDFRTSTDMSHA